MCKSRCFVADPSLLSVPLALSCFMIYPVLVIEAIYRCEHYDDVEKGAGERLSIKDTGMKVCYCKRTFQQAINALVFFLGITNACLALVHCFFFRYRISLMKPKIAYGKFQNNFGIIRVA